MSKKLTITGVVAAVAVVYLGLHFGERPAGPGDAETQLDDAELERLANSEAMSLIAAESKAIDAGTASSGEAATELADRSSAPPGFVPAPPLDHEATPPEGYSFTGYHEVAYGPMRADDVDRGEPAEPPEWMTFGDGAVAELAHASGRDWSFGWVKLAEGADVQALDALLSGHDGAVLGQAGDLVRVRLPGDPSSLRAIAESPSVAGLGAVPAERKITDTLHERALANIHEEVPVWITLMSDDPDGEWRQALKRLGAEVGAFDAQIRSYAATIPLTALAPISRADFVLAVESIGRVVPTLEMAAAAMGADAVRHYDAATDAWMGTGGASVTVGVMDSGLNIDHPDISSNRRSICGANFTNFFNSRDEDQDLWFDFGQHGTHVAGIVLGNGAAGEVGFHQVGMAPLVQDIRVAKALGTWGTASAIGWNRAMDWFATPTACGDDVPRKVLVINSSLGVTGGGFEGRTIVQRKIDASVWAARQLFVTSAGNSSDTASSGMANAKNVLSVGAAQNIGDLAVFSSQGPTGDGRLMPKIVGTGVKVASPAGRGSKDEYNIYSGTSMSSPAVVGVAALVMDAVPELKEEPAALRARLMASAIKPDAFLGDAAAFPLDNTNGPGTLNNQYGLGKVSARTAVLSRDEEDGWIGGSAAFDIDGSGHAYHDIVVPEGASRLDIVMTWDEPPAETITNSVLHDLDLWVDRGASCGDVAACGHYNSRSRIDNVEWVIVPNPPAGVYRLKVLPNRVYGAAPRAGLAWTVIRGDSTPTLHVAVEDDHIDVGADASFDVDVTLTSDAYVAAGANLRVECRAAVGSTACDELAYTDDESTVHREDGLERNLKRDGASIVVGEIGPDEEQTISLRFSGQSEGAFRLHFSASGWNAASGDASVAVTVDGAPGMPAPVRRPPNDDFANATELDSMGGETTFDIAAATPEPGEPAYILIDEHPQRVGSLWYVWTAPESGLARFAVARSTPGDHSDFVVVEIFRDAPLTRLPRVGHGQLGGGGTFFAKQGETYRIRLSIDPGNLWRSGTAGDDATRRALPDLTLSWGPGSRPEHDDYGHAAVVEGATGTMAGTNQGATTEPAEFMGNSNRVAPNDARGWSSSVWYRWTAPSSGDYHFAVNRLAQVVAAFEGDNLAEARMVSGIPGQGSENPIVFPATEGVEYHIGVATGSAWWAGTEFELSWAPGARELPGNDDFADAAATFGTRGYGSVRFNDLTVEHGEPAASGVRTAWWSWQAPEDGRFTWQLNRLGGGFFRDEAPLQMSVFAGEELSALAVVAMDRGDETIATELAFDTRVDTTYRFAVGLPRDAAQVPLETATLLMQWGPTPENDDLANAIALAGNDGSVSGTNEFATTEKGEHTGTLGDSSLWWTYEREESGWVRFELDGARGSKLAIYRIAADGGMELVRISQKLGMPTATIYAEAGVRYVVRFGTYYRDEDGYGSSSRGDFELTWQQSAAPALLRFVDFGWPLINDGLTPVIGRLGNQTFNPDGTELYLASSVGILVFDRDVDTGKVDLTHALLDHPVEPSTPMIWDDAGAALLVAGCDGWKKFTAAADGGIEHAGSVVGAPCPVGDVLVHGDIVHHVMAPWLIETYRFDEAHDSLSSAGVTMIPDVTQAAMTADGHNVYAIADDGGDFSLLAMERDAETGDLRIANIIANGSSVTGEEGSAVVEGLTNVQALAVNGSHLFVSVGSGGAETLAFDLADRANPVFLGKQESFRVGFGTCRLALARHGIPAVDVACGGSETFTVQVADDSVVASDLALGDYRDSFGNRIWKIDNVQSIAGSPDGRHLYVAGEQSFFDSRLLVFERVHGN